MSGAGTHNASPGRLDADTFFSIILVLLTLDFKITKHQLRLAGSIIV